MQQTLFAGILVASLAIFAFSCYRRLALVSVGTGEYRFDHPMTRLNEVLVYALGQKRVMKRPFGINHGVIFWAFLVLTLANAEFLISGVFPSLNFTLLPPPLHGTLSLLFELCSLATLAAVSLAFLRRIFNPPYEEARTFEAFFILTMIAGLMVAYFGVHAAEIAMGEASPSFCAPVSSLLASLLNHTSLTGQLPVIKAVSWWVHAVLLLSFMNFLPYSKHMHILTAIPNVFLRSLGKVNSQPREEFAEGRSFGASSVDRLSWKDLLDSFSCTECGRCQNSCPAAATGKQLNPRMLIHAIKESLLGNGSALPSPVDAAAANSAASLIGKGEGKVSEAALWSCTSCGSCMESCPVFIEHLPKVVKLRRHLVEMEARFPEELLNLFENMEQRSNPWGMAPSERSKWCSQLDLKPFEAGKTEYLLFVGCSGAFDARNKQVTVALTKVLDAAGVSYGILGKDEKCCGESVRRLGNEFLFETMANENVSQLRSRGVTKVITQCPHCFNTLKNDYRQYGLELEVIHHTEFIKGLIDRGSVEVKGGGDLGRVVFHDSCYLGRHNEVYEPPREVIRQVTGKAVHELPRNKENGFCCGAGGGRMWLEEHEGTAINRSRVKEALDQKPATICVSCPFCMTMFEDGIKEFTGVTTQVKDIAEVVAQSL
ncbi:electron transfer flavoprotein [Geomonas sp. Red276]